MYKTKLRYSDRLDRFAKEQRMWNLTFIAISECVAVDVEGVVAEEQEAEPGLERVDGNDQQDPDDPTLLSRILVVYQVLVNLQLNLDRFIATHNLRV